MAVPVPADASSHIAEKHSLNSQPTSDDGVPENSISSTDGRKEKSEEGSSPPEDPGHEYLTSLKLFFVLCGVTLVCFLVMLDTSIISTAIPKMTTEFHSLGDIGWYGSSYQIASACLQPLAGRIFVNFSSKWTFMVFFFIFELGSLLCGIASSSKMFIIARAVAGMGSSGLLNGALTIVSSVVPLHKSPPLMGLMMGVSQLGTVGGPLLGGAFTEYLTWRWCFYINLPVGALVAIFLAFIRIPDQVAKPSIRLALSTIHHRLDLIGFALFAPAAIQLLLAMEYGQQSSWGDATVIGLFCGAAATFAVFLLWEHRQGEKAMIPLEMVAKRQVWSSCFVILAVFAITLCTAYYLPIYFQATKNDSPTMSGVSMLPGILSQVLASVASGFLIAKLGYYYPWTIFGGTATAIGSGLLSTLRPGTPIGKWVGYQIISGVGRGSAFQTPLIAIQNNLPRAQISIAMSILMFIQTLSGAIFLTVANVAFDSGLKSFVPEYAPNVDPQTLISAGATGIQNVVSSDDLSGVLMAYSKSIGNVFIMSAAFGVLVVVFSFGMGMKDIRPGKSDPGNAK